MSPAPSLRPVAWWLLICAAMVFAMVVLGGATRLTESGLSMVHWKPLTLLPPMNAAEWQAEFAAYQQTPEFIKVNAWMTVEDFKGIYWLEYLHRLWGRIIGVVFFVPFVWFLAKRVVDRPLAWKLAGLFVLGGLQGVLGWYMVASGLVDRTDVSQYRLAAHLITAFIVYGLLIWVALDLLRGTAPRAVNRGLSRLSVGIALGTLLVVLSGALVAGLDAGLIYNTFPLMDGRWVPEGLYDLRPWYLNHFENVIAVQFQHRMFAMMLAAAVVALWWRSRRLTLTPRARILVKAVLIMTGVQAALGITTLLLVVPLPLALAHQSGALMVFTLAVWLAHETHATTAHQRASLNTAYANAAE